MKSFKAILSLSIAASTCAALISCNKGGGNDNQPAPAPVQPVGQMPYQPPVFNPGAFYPQQQQGIPPRPVVKPQQLSYIACYTSVLNYGSSRIGYATPPEIAVPFDNSKAVSQEIPYHYSSIMGKVTLNIQPEGVDANGNFLAPGYMELVLSDLSGGGTSTLRGRLDAHLNLEIDDQQRERQFKIDCSLKSRQQYGEMIDMMDGGDSRASYTCSTSLPQVAATATTATPPNVPIGGAPKPFTTKSKPQVLIETAAQALKIENGTSHSSGYIVLNDKRKSQNRTVNYSVRFGQPFMVTTNSSGSLSTSILCQPAVNATQQK